MTNILLILGLILTTGNMAMAGCSPAYCGDQGGLGPSPGHGAQMFLETLVLGSNLDETATGIPIDTEWKRKVYAFALQNVVHPSWGISHSERDYQMTKKIAMADGIAIDLDVLFASAFLHDLGGIDPFAVTGVDHALRSAELVEPLLRDWGFPMEKFSDVKEMILGHTYYGWVPNKPQSLAFRDADILDFLGAIGIARILAITEEPGRSNSTLKPALGLLHDFEVSMPKKLSLNHSKLEAKPRIKQMKRYFKEIGQEDIHGSAQ